MRAFFLFALHLTFILNIASAQQPSAPSAVDQKSSRDAQIRERDQLWLQAQTLQSEGRVEDAIAVGERVLAIERKVYGDTHEELTGTMEWLSQKYLTASQLPEAEDYAIELQRVQEELHGKTGWQAVSAHWRLDYVRKLRKTAPANLARMLAIEADFNSLLSKGMYAEAAAELAKLLQLEESVLGSDHPYVANTLTNQADCFLSANQSMPAKGAAERALAIHRKQLGEKHPDTARATFLFARSHIQLQQHEEALKHLELAREAYRASQQPVDAAWMDSWRGVCLAALNHDAAAKQAYLTALEDFRKLNHADGEALQLKNIAELDGSVDVQAELSQLRKQVLQSLTHGNLEEAVAHGERQLALERVSMAPASVAITSTLRWLANLDETNLNWNKAVARRVEILKRETARLGETHFEVVNHRLAMERVRQLGSFTSSQLQQFHLAEQLAAEVHKQHAAGAYGAAIRVAEQVCAIRKLVQGEKHIAYAESLHDLAVLHAQLDNHKKAASIYTEALQIRKLVLGERHPEYANTLSGMAGVYESMNDYAKSESLHRKALEIRKTVLGERHQDYASSLGRLAALYVLMGDYKQPLALYLQALDVLKSTVGERHEEYVSTLGNLALLYEAIGDYEKAESAHLEAINLDKLASRDKHPSHAIQLNNLAGCYMETFRYTKAEPLYLRALEIHRAAYGVEHLEYTTTLGNLALLYDLMGDKEKAERIYIQAIEVQRRSFGEHHPSFAVKLNNLGLLYLSATDYTRAEPLLLQAAGIIKLGRGDSHPEYATSIRNLATFYESMGDYLKAEPLFLQAMDLEESTFGSRHPRYARSLNSLANLYASLGKFEKAETLYLQAVEIEESSIGVRHPEHAIVLNNFGLMCNAMGDFAKAERLILQAVEILKGANLQGTANHATCLNNLASVYLSVGHHAKSEPLIVESLEILKVLWGEKHLNYSTSLANAAILYESLHDSTKADALFLQSIGIARDVAERTALIQAERQQLAMGQLLRKQLDGYVSFTLRSRQYQASAARELLRWKGATLTRQRAMRLAAADPFVTELFREVQQVSRELASVCSAPASREPDSRRQKVSDLTAEKERLEAQLSRESAAFRSTMEEVTAERIQGAIPRDAVLIDYLQFNRMQSSSRNGQSSFTTSILAVIVRPVGEPQLVELGSSTALRTAIDTWRQSFGLPEVQQQAGLAVRRQIWEPLLSHIGDAATILVSTDGPLGRIPLGALPGNEPGKYLLEDHRIAMIPVPQLLPALVDDAAHTTTSQGLLLLGNVDYNSEAPQADGAATTERKKRRIGEYRGDLVDVEYQTLPGAAEEVELIRKLYSEIPGNKATDIQLLKQTEASEAAFRENAGKFRHIHVATHGFFAPATAQSAFSPEAINDAADRSSTILSPAAGVGPVPQITGIGARLEAVEEGAVVGQLHPGGPAARGGNLKAGDVIIGVGEGDGEILSLAGKPLPQIAERIRGLEGSTVRLRVQPSGSTDTQVVSIVRGAVPGAAVGAPAESSVAFPAEMLEFQPRGFNPDVLSGLALAGANLKPEPGKDDGILTAQEIAFLPLSGVDTAVLSACETGLGSSAGGEGLISVQRAFQISGVRTTVASLWKVDDRVTQFLMERFYRNLWQKKMTRLDAMREAQLYLLRNPQQVSELLRSVKRAEDSQKFSDVSPFYWAAFTLSGDWR